MAYNFFSVFLPKSFQRMSGNMGHSYLNKATKHIDFQEKNQMI